MADIHLSTGESFEHIHSAPSVTELVEGGGRAATARITGLAGDRPADAHTCGYAPCIEECGQQVGDRSLRDVRTA